MKKTLGLDLGSNSLGWAILDNESGNILDAGVLVFPEGINPVDDALNTPAAIRRRMRMARRIKFHRKIRKWNVLNLLWKNGMCPITEEELKEWKVHGRYPTGNKAFIRWLKATDASNPYCDRAAAADGPVAPEVLGRALYHLAQRRGFKSSRKDAAEAGEEEDGKDKIGEVKAGIQTLTEEIHAAGCKTLGQYFHKCLEEDRDKPAKRRIRKRYTGRNEHYETEFAAIMDAQGEAVSTNLRNALHDALFDQRPIRSQAKLAGLCPLEPKSPRAQIAHPAFEEFRMLAFINNLTLEDAAHEWRDATGHPLYPLTAEDRALVRKAFMKAAPTFKFGDIAKLFKNDPRFKRDDLRFHYYRNEETLPACSLLHRLGGIFGKGDDADPFSYQAEFDALTFYDDTEKLRGWLAKHHPGLPEEAVESFLNIHLREGRAQYSLKAIRRILPFLREGYPLTEARFFAKLGDVIPDFAARKDEILRALLDIEEAYRREKANRSREHAGRDEPRLVPLMNRWHSWLEETCGVDEEKWKSLYLHDGTSYVAQTKSNGVPLAKPRLPPVKLGMLRNPLVQRATTTLRRLVNYLGEHGKIDPSDTTIRIELARNVNDSATRLAWQDWQNERKKMREAAREAITAARVRPTEDRVDRYILWEEQGHRCLYTGQEIKPRKLLVASENAPYDIEHTIPRCQCGDDSLANKTVCEKVYNREIKKGRIPRDCPNWKEIEPRLLPWREKLEKLEKGVKSAMNQARSAITPKAHLAARRKAIALRFQRDYWRDKLRRFDATREQLEFGTGDLTGFKKRQLVDTGIMTRHAVEFLRCLYSTYAVNGTATAFARRAWGIQTDEAKDRNDHTHHAIDAMVIAALTPARFTAICSALKDDGRTRARPCDVCPPPFKDFAKAVHMATGRILVKHVQRQTTLRQSSKRNKVHLAKGHADGKIVRVLAQGDTVRGQLHKDTFYGRIQVPGKLDKQYVIRRPLEGTIEDIKALAGDIVEPKERNIVDLAIWRIVVAAIQAAEVEGKTSFSPGDIVMPSGVPIRRVRVFAPPNAGPVPLRDHALPSQQAHKRSYYVSVGKDSYFRFALFQRDGRLEVVRENSLSWAQEHRKPDYVPLHERAGFLGYVMPDSMALTHSPNNPGELRTLPQDVIRKRLYKVVNFEKDGRMILRFHAEARATTVLAAELKAEGKPGNGKGSSTISLDAPHELLRLRPSTYRNQVIFEGVHFRMLMDGSIRFMDSGNPELRKP